MTDLAHRLRIVAAAMSANQPHGIALKGSNYPLLNEAADRIEALERLFAAPAQQVEAEKWISVDTKRPDEGQHVIVSLRTEYRNAPPHWSVGTAIFRAGQWWSAGQMIYTPTHWMPMPLPPAAGSNNGEKGA